MINNFGLFNSLVVIVGSLLVIINIVLAPFNPYAEKNNPFECGFLSFIWQNRVQFSISFFIFALLFLLFDLEVLLVFPYFVSTYTNDIAGLVSMVIFLLLLVIGFGFELGKKALKINSKQLEITIVDIDEANKNSFVNTASISLTAFGDFLLHLAIIFYLVKNKLFSYAMSSNVCLWLYYIVTITQIVFKTKTTYLNFIDTKPEATELPESSDAESEVGESDPRTIEELLHVREELINRNEELSREREELRNTIERLLDDVPESTSSVTDTEQSTAEQNSLEQDSANNSEPARTITIPQNDSGSSNSDNTSDDFVAILDTCTDILSIFH